jgi:RNA polymerase sigma-70 factor (ECF subfamily)
MTGVFLVLVIVAFAVVQAHGGSAGDTHAHRELDRKEVAAIASGDQAALGRVYDRFHRLVFSLALRVLGDRTEAEEVSQDVFLRLWHRAGNFDPARGELLGWLITVTRNRAIDTLRSRQHRESGAWTPMPESLDTAGWMGTRLATPPAAAAIEASQRVGKMLESLGEPQRKIIELSYYEGYSQSEIAELLHLPLGSVKTWTRTALAALRGACPECG